MSLQLVGLLSDIINQLILSLLDGLDFRGQLSYGIILDDYLLLNRGDAGVQDIDLISCICLG